jgi:hypothetical protein
MEEQPTTLATRVAVGPETDAEGATAATLRLRRELPDLSAGAVGLSQAGGLPPGARAVELAARAGGQRRPVAPAYPFGGHGPADPVSAGVNHRAASQVRRAPSAGRGPTAEGSPGISQRSR